MWDDRFRHNVLLVDVVDVHGRGCKYLCQRVHTTCQVMKMGGKEKVTVTPRRKKERVKGQPDKKPTRDNKRKDETSDKRRDDEGRRESARGKGKDQRETVDGIMTVSTGQPDICTHYAYLYRIQSVYSVCILW
jgi:hypothetical protein